MDTVAAKQILENLIEMVEETGGVVENLRGNLVPAGPVNEADLGDLYRWACEALGRPIKRKS